MTRRHDKTRPRRPLSLAEVAMVAGLVVFVFGIGLYLPTLSLKTADAAMETAPSGTAALSLMNVQQAMPTQPRVSARVSVTAPAMDDAVVAESPAEPVVMFDGRPLRRAKQMPMLTTAYSPDEKSCGKWADGFTASGFSVWTNGMKLVAADTSVLPFGTIVSIPGYNNGKPVQVLDRGGKIKGNRLDLLYPTHEIALQWGVKRLVVDVWEYAD